MCLHAFGIHVYSLKVMGKIVTENNVSSILSSSSYFICRVSIIVWTYELLLCYAALLCVALKYCCLKNDPWQCVKIVASYLFSAY